MPVLVLSVSRACKVQVALQIAIQPLSCSAETTVEKATSVKPTIHPWCRMFYLQVMQCVTPLGLIIQMHCSTGCPSMSFLSLSLSVSYIRSFSSSTRFNLVTFQRDLGGLELKLSSHSTPSLKLQNYVPPREAHFPYYYPWRKLSYLVTAEGKVWGFMWAHFQLMSMNPDIFLFSLR